MRAFIFLAGLIAVLGSSVQAGAWARGEGKSFASVTAFATWPAGRAPEMPDVYVSTYAEYGLSPRLTFGLDLGSADYANPDRHKALAFVRYTLTEASSANQAAIDFGAGRDEAQPVVRLGLAYGRGMQMNGHNGWFSAEATGHYAPQSNQHALSGNITVGISAGRMKYLAQVSGSQAYSGLQTATFTPSVVRQLNDRMHLQLGAAIGLKNKPDPALKVGVWIEF